VREELGRRGIPAGLRKGMALIGTAYADEGERPCTDIDLYIDPSDARETRAVLEGWATGGGLRGSDSFALERRGAPVRCIVDCHWELGFAGRSRRDWRSVIGNPLGSDGALTETAFAADLVGHLWHHAFRGLLRYSTSPC